MNEIERRRKALGLSREQLAVRAGISSSTLYNIEKSLTKPIRSVRDAIENTLKEIEKG